MTEPHLKTVIYENFPSKSIFKAPIVDEFTNLFCSTFYPLAFDPRIEKKSLLIGMFVLRPIMERWEKPILDEHGSPESMYGICGWAYNCDHGGAVISNGNCFDGTIMAFQYATCDAVIIGTKSLSLEGCNVLSEEKTTVVSYGHLCQYYSVCSWNNVYAYDAFLSEKLEKQRELLQKIGIISGRKYPAQVVISWSGGIESSDASNDFLGARVFHETHPSGEAMEVYIVTSKIGAVSLRQRARLFGLQDRIDSMLIVLSPRCSTCSLGDGSTNGSCSCSSRIDLASLPEVLYTRFDIRVANHDGGREVLRRFCATAGVMGQLSLTLCRKKSLFDLLIEKDKLLPFESPVDAKSAGLEYFLSHKVAGAFTSPPEHEASQAKEYDWIYKIPGMGSIPRSLVPIRIVKDFQEEVALTVFTIPQIDSCDTATAISEAFDM